MCDLRFSSCARQLSESVTASRSTSAVGWVEPVGTGVESIIRYAKAKTWSRDTIQTLPPQPIRRLRTALLLEEPPAGLLTALIKKPPGLFARFSCGFHF